MSRIIAALLWVAPSLSFAAGLTFGENGTKAFSMGGAFVGQADDLTAVQFNTRRRHSAVRTTTHADGTQTTTQRRVDTDPPPPAI